MLERCAQWGRAAGKLWLAAVPLSSGLLLAAMLIVWWSQTLASLGGTLPLLSGLTLAAMIGVGLGIRLGEQPRLFGAAPWMLIGLALWTVMHPWLVQWPHSALGSIPWEWLSQPAVEFVVGLACGATLLTIPHLLLAFLAVRGGFRTSETARTSPSLGGMAAGLALAPVWFVPEFGLQITSLLAAVMAAAWGLSLLLSAATPAVARAANPMQDRAAARVPGSWSLVPATIAAVAAGVLLTLAERIASQLWLWGVYSSFSIVAGFVAGYAVIRRLSQTQSRFRFPSSLPGAAAVAVGFVALAAWGFPLLVRGILQLNANVSDVYWLLTMRAGIGAALAFPAGMLAAAASRAVADKVQRGEDFGPLLPLIVACTWVICRWCLPEPAHLALAAAAGGLATAIAGSRQGFSMGDLPLSRRLATAATGVAAAVGACGILQIDPGLSARLLFSTVAAAASDSAADDDLLLALDDARLIDVIPGRQTVWTAWKQRGATVVLRGDGVFHSEMCMDTTVAPDSAAEVVASALPLVVHPAPDHVLVVGLGSSVALSSSLEFPVRTVTCIEQDPDLLRLVRGARTEAAVNPFADPRLQVRCVSPALSASAELPERYDVILLNERQLAGPRNLGQMSVEAYRRWGAQLSPGGVLCQRIEYVDWGAEPLRELAATMAAAFPQVILWESSPGEMLLLATHSEEPLVDERLLGRLETPHVRRLLARIGWDVSVPLSVISVKPDHLAGMLGEETGGAAQASSRFAFSLPVEIARWGAKGQELQSMLRSHALPVLSWFPESPEVEGMRKRIADMSEQRNLVAQYPDHFWAYRKSLRQRLQERPRSAIVQVKHEGLRKEMHPEDQRRKEYLLALNEAATQKSPSPESIAAVAEFAEPFDPLLSPFVHREVARLYERCATSLPELEIRHLLHSVYYSPGVDRSVHDTLAAIRLLTQEECLSDPAERWDHVNALLETLRIRWGLRSRQSAPSRFDPADARETIDAAKEAIDFLARTAPESGIDPEWSELRCRVLERTLVRSLRSYHAEQAAKLERIQEQRAAANQSNVTR